jgi:hypothetical protein
MNANIDCVTNIARHFGFNVPEKWSGIDVIWPLCEKMRSDGATLIVKLDGERIGPDDTGPYTVLASGAPLGGDSIRIDATSIEDALAYVIAQYARKVWGIPLPA